MKLIDERIVYDSNSNMIYKIECDDDKYMVNLNYIRKLSNEVEYEIDNDIIFCTNTGEESKLNPIRRLTVEELVPYLHLII